jgi:hypothetical protein
MAGPEVKAVENLLGTPVSYAYAVKAGPWIFLNGHEAFDFESGIPEEVAGPAGFPLFGRPRSRREGDFILHRMRRILREFGSDLSHGVRLDQYYPNPRAVAAYHLARHAKFDDYIPPSRQDGGSGSCLRCPGLPQSVEKTFTDVSRKRHVLARPRHREIWSQSEKSSHRLRCCYCVAQQRGCSDERIVRREMPRMPFNRLARPSHAVRVASRSEFGECHCMSSLPANQRIIRAQPHRSLGTFDGVPVRPSVIEKSGRSRRKVLIASAAATASPSSAVAWAGKNMPLTGDIRERLLDGLRKAGAPET